MVVAGRSGVDHSAVPGTDPAAAGMVHLLAVFTRREYRRLVGGLSGSDRSPDAAARACPAVASTADRLRTAGRRVQVHGRVTGRQTAAVTDVASAVDADRVVVDDLTVGVKRLEAAGPWAVAGVETEPQWFLTE